MLRLCWDRWVLEYLSRGTGTPNRLSMSLHRLQGVKVVVKLTFLVIHSKDDLACFVVGIERRVACVDHHAGKSRTLKPLTLLANFEDERYYIEFFSNIAGVCLRC